MATSTLRTLQLDFAEGIQFTKNYIQNSTFQYNTSNGWAKFNTTLTNGYPTGAISNGAASITTFAITPTNPISGNYSLQFASSSVWAAGQGFISDEFTIQREDLGKPLTFNFSYEVVANPLNANWSGQLGSQTFAVYIYDVTAGAWIQPSGFLGMNQTSGVGQVMGNFQSSVVSGQKYRLAIIALQSSAGAITINFDNFFLGKQISTVGSPVTDFIDFSPTINWTGSGSTYNTTGSFRRIGDSLEVKVKISITNTISSVNTELLINLPSGFTIDTTKMLSPLQGGAPTYGDAIGRDGVSGNLYLLRCQYWTNTSVKLFYQSASSGQETAVSYTVPNAWAATDTIIATFQVPVVGLSSSVQMSNATDTRVVAASYGIGTTALSVTGLSPILWPTIFNDTHSAYNTLTGAYTVPVSGIYRISLSSIYSSTAGYQVIRIFKNGSISQEFMQVGNANFPSSASTQISCNAGDILTFVSDLNLTIVYSANQYRARVSIERLSGPSVVAATETVAASYWASANGTSSTTSPFNFDAKEYDTHNAVTTGASWKFTAPVSGVYSVSFYTNQNSPGNAVYYKLYKNSTTTSYKTLGYCPATVGLVTASTSLRLNAGDYIGVYSHISQNYLGNASLNSDYVSHISINRIGN
jgi:hypothetical protein